MNRKAKRMIFTAVFISYVCLGVLNPLVAPLIRELGLAETDAGWIVSASSVMVLLSSPLWGMLSDRAGRKPVIVLGLLGVAISFLMFGFAARWGMQRGDAAPASLFWLLLVSRLFLGLSFPAVLSASQAYIADITAEQERASGMALLGAANGMGFVIGPAIGAFLSGVSLTAPVFLCAALPLTGMLWIAVSMPAAKPAVSERQGIKLRRATVPFLLTALILMMAMVQIQVTAGFYFQDKLQLSPAETAQAIGACLFVIGVMMALVQRFVVRKFQWAPSKLLRWGIPLFLAGLLILLCSSHFALYAAAFALLGMGGGLAISGFTSGASLTVPRHEQGAAAGMIAACIGVGSLIGPLSGTFLYRVRPEAPFGLLALLLLLLTVYVYTSRQIRRPKDETAASIIS